ncbi:MAG TPA: hypothetical protein VD978_33685 [Azospirillum sp.]|nr:hypothetical protein [Azospirillum sp.]
MSTKTYILQTDSRQFPTKKAGDPVELPPTAAKYLVQAGVLADPATIQPRELADGEMLTAAPLPEGSTATDVGAAEAPAAGKRRKGAEG